MKPEFRQIIMANFTPEHIHVTMQQQLQNSPCALHPDNKACCLSPADLLVMGTPCPPFSTQRTKRFVHGSVKQHRDFNVTWLSAHEAICSCLHGAIVLEQVEGFAKKEPGEDETPLNLPGCT